jgi:hypothetical protein
MKATYFDPPSKMLHKRIAVVARLQRKVATYCIGRDDILAGKSSIVSVVLVFLAVNYMKECGIASVKRIPRRFA